MAANDSGPDALDCNGRGVFIHRVMALATGPLSPAEIGELAERLARLACCSELKPTTFASGSVRQHLRFMAERGHAEQPTPRGGWVLTPLALRKFAKP